MLSRFIHRFREKELENPKSQQKFSKFESVFTRSRLKTCPYRKARASRRRFRHWLNQRSSEPCRCCGLVLSKHRFYDLMPSCRLERRRDTSFLGRASHCCGISGFSAHFKAFVRLSKGRQADDQ